ncbi:MAG: Trk system potassium transporter TrkA [Candidatus Heteroscillospira sp.]|jgi:trk system potassium uptake protein TrkA
MRIVIIGGGKVGSELAAQLSHEEHDVVLIDNNRRVVKQLGEALDMLTIYGNGASLELQRQADVGGADLLIAATPQDELNMICCIIARKLGCQNAIARVRNPEYARQMYFLRDELGLSLHVNPEWSTAREIFRLMQYPGFLKRDAFAKGRVEIVELDVAAGGALDGVLLSELPKKLRVKVLVCAIQRGADVIIPDGNFRLQAYDRIHVTAPTAQLVALLSSIGLRQSRSKNAMLIGGSRITQYLAESLIKAGTNVKIIELDDQKSTMLAEKLPKATIINADGTNQTVLNSENISQMDTVVALTNMDEENLIISMYAKHVGVPQVITKINRTEYMDLFRETGIDCIVSPKHLCAQDIVRYVRAMQNTGGSGVISVHNLLDGKVEAIEMRVTEHTKYKGIQLKDVKLKPNILISCINHMDKIVIPGGSDTAVPGDTVIVVSLAGRVILDLNDIFQE